MYSVPDSDRPRSNFHVQRTSLIETDVDHDVPLFPTCGRHVHDVGCTQIGARESSKDHVARKSPRGCPLDCLVPCQFRLVFGPGIQSFFSVFLSVLRINISWGSSATIFFWRRLLAYSVTTTGQGALMAATSSHQEQCLRTTSAANDRGNKDSNHSRERVCVCVCVCHNEKRGARRMASTTSDTGDTSSKQQQAQCKENYNKSKRPVSSVDHCHPYRRKKRREAVY